MTRQIFRSILLILGVMLFCCLSLFAIWRLAEPKSPVSPPETQLNTEPSFDTILVNANEAWRFLFGFKGQLIATDIYGQSDQVLLDFSDAIGSKCYSLLGEGSLSPDSKYLIIKYDLDERTETGEIIGKLIIFDLENGRIENIPTPLSDFQLAWGRSVIWLSSTVFLVPMQRWIYEDGHTVEIVKFLRYDVQTLEDPHLVEFDTDTPYIVVKQNPNVLLFGSEYDPSDELVVHAFDVRGKRKATVEEHKFFVCYRDWQCRQDILDERTSNIRIEPVIPDNIEGFGRYYNENAGSYYVYLNDNLVRVSDGEINDLNWDPDLNLYIWDEFGRPDVFYMDAEGHYRAWHNGSYWGKIPINLRVAKYQRQTNVDCQ